ncbi:hypothetical protein [Streptomyces silvensis]|uniref:Secreted protein n=1 Tax=Streptomyces silvensis TaxID=1765722 RepID=A0A0W7WQZ0_9ACTN|nr:hypothetical protein [Streptomyces silvensis]KUF13022.1 hypothetical protein AT728_37415 [Streptomyces silvensis]
MKLRRTMKTRRAMTAVAITTGLVLAVAGCGGGDDGGDDDSGKGSSASAPAKDKSDQDADEPQDSSSEETLAEVKSNGITLTVASAERDEGGFLTLSGTVTNGTSGRWIGAEWRSDEKELSKNGGSLAGASLIDQAGKKKYLILRDTEGRCLCTQFQGGVAQGATTEWFAQFPAPPEGTSKLSLQLPSMPPAPIEISEGE